MADVGPDIMDQKIFIASRVIFFSCSMRHKLPNFSEYAWRHEVWVGLGAIHDQPKQLHKDNPCIRVA
jgi:hypothetical protein